LAQRSINYSLEDLARLLLERENIHEGYGEIGVSFEGQAMMSATPTSGNKFVPSMMVRVLGINLVEQHNQTPASIKAQ
jgi:hypothetical protein